MIGDLGPQAITESTCGKQVATMRTRPEENEVNWHASLDTANTAHTSHSTYRQH